MLIDDGKADAVNAATAQEPATDEQCPLPANDIY